VIRDCPQFDSHSTTMVFVEIVERR